MIASGNGKNGVDLRRFLKLSRFQLPFQFLRLRFQFLPQSNAGAVDSRRFDECKALAGREFFGKKKQEEAHAIGVEVDFWRHRLAHLVQFLQACEV